MQYLIPLILYIAVSVFIYIQVIKILRSIYDQIPISLLIGQFFISLIWPITIARFLYENKIRKG